MLWKYLPKEFHLIRGRNQMRSIVITMGGLLLLGLCLIAGRNIGGGAAGAMATAAKVLLPIWLAAALVNMWMGVARAGYSVAEELPIFLAVFAIPAGVALFVWWKYS
jgi:hypothetical protein